MKKLQVIANSHTYLEVVDESGNVLFVHNPFKNVDYIGSDFYREAAENKTNGETLIDLIQKVIRKGTNNE